LAEKTQTLQQTLGLIADILNPCIAPKQLHERLGNGTVDWDQMVIVGSKHLVLPALYCNLQRKSLLESLPPELASYLKMLTDINRERNRSLLNEASHISALLQQHNIDHVFIKGMGMLAGDNYLDMGERMIGDIDILVAQEQLDKAFDILEADGYNHFIKFNYETRNYRHKPRQISNTKLAGVELHGALLRHRYRNLIDVKDVLAKKNSANGIAVPCPEHLIKNTIFAQQINDRGTFFGSLNLKGTYDVICTKLHKNDLLKDELSKTKHGSCFLGISSVFFKNLSPSQNTSISNRYRKSYMARLKHQKLSREIYRAKSVFINVYDRIMLLLTNESYRAHILKHKILKEKT